VWWWKEANPVSKLRGLAFDAKLGMYNIGQFFIQTSTMVSATALSPKYGFKGMMTTLPLHAYLLSKGPAKENVLDVLAKRGVGKAAGFASEQEFKEYARFLDRSGFLDMNGSHVMIGQNGPSAHFGTFAEKASKGRESARFFFYSAEVWNRLVASRIAWGELEDAGVKAGSDGFLAQFMKKADDYSMNMTHESAAYWQKGVLSLPTQFWSYNVRMMDAMFGSRFTKAQRARLITANLLMAGSAGTAITEGLSEFIKSQYQVTPDINTVLGTLDRGFFDRMAYEVTGADVRISEKLGTGTWFGETLNTFFGESEYQQKSVAEVLGGASASILGNMGTELINVATYAAAESGAEDMEVTGDAVLKMFQEISTFSNAYKAMTAAQYGVFRSNAGNVTEIPTQDAAYIALGFRPQETDTMAHRMKWVKEKDKMIKEAAKQIVKWRQESFFIPDKRMENAQKVNTFVRLIPAAIRKDVMKQANRAKENQTLFKHIEKKYEQEVVQPTNEEGLQN
jgi:hypothetical protein